MADLVGRHAHQIAGTALSDIARMSGVKVVGDPPADPIEFDTEDDLVAVRQGLAFVERQVLRREHLHLHRHGQAIPSPSWPKSKEALPGLEHGPRRHRLETVEVCQSIGVGFVRPGKPKLLDPILEHRILDQ